mgnify:CR=1 FL=1
MSEYLVDIQHERLSFFTPAGEVKALNDVSIHLNDGEVLGIVGESGSGKSVTAYSLMGLTAYPGKLVGGTIDFNGHRINDLSEKEFRKIRGNEVSIIFQDPMTSLNPVYTIGNQIMEVILLHTDKNKEQARARAKELLELVGINEPEKRLKQYPHELSGGMRQRVMIAIALACEPKLLIADEPTTALTKKEVSALFKIILKLKEQGIAILFISHKLDEVFEISDRFTIFRDGELVATGSTKELDDKKFTYYMTGREFSDNIFVPKNVSDKPVFELKHLTLNGSFSDINLSLRRGEILGITGLLDSGRTELGLSMFGLKPADSGQIIKDGKEIKLTSPREAIANSIGYVPEDRLSEGLFLTQSIGDNIIISEIDKLKKKNGQFDLKKRDEEIEKWVKELEIKTKNPNNPATTLSGGNQQRIVLAKWLACNLDVLILNGPTVGVDIGSKHDIHMVLQRLANQGLGVIIISDDLPEVIQNCSRVLVIKNGKIKSEYDTQNVSEQMIIDDMM